MPDITIPAASSGVTAAWLTEALRAGGVLTGESIRSVAAEDIGAGRGNTGELTRLNLTLDVPNTALPTQLVAKFPTAEPENLHIAHSLGLYAREIGFYQHLADSAPVRTPRVYFADIDPATQAFVLLMEDLGQARIGDQVAGASEADAYTSITEIAKLHAAWWGKVDTPATSTLFDFANTDFVTAVQNLYQAYLQPALDKFPELFSDRGRAIVEAYAPHVAEHVRRMASGHRTLIHGDYRADNMFYDLSGGDDLAVVDWQVCGRSSGLYDVACFLAGSMPSELRRRIERDVLVAYHQTLLDGGVDGYDFETCWSDYRRATLAIVIAAIYATGGFDVGNERGRALATASLARSLAAIEDLDADAFIEA